MTLSNDSPTLVALNAFRDAWARTTRDYAKLRLTSEGCLQAAVYFHLRNLLGKKGYRVFVEAVTKLPEVENETKKRAVVDLLIEHESKVVLVVELKYRPKGMPDGESIKKDLHSLSKFANTRSKRDRATVKLLRFLNDETKSLDLRLTAETYRVFGIICADETHLQSEEMFWRAFKPSKGRWEELKKIPIRLGVAVMITKPNSKRIKKSFLGMPFKLAERGY